jgi:hypothetical protein
MRVPNSTSSAICSGRAAQSTVTSGRLLRMLQRWSWRATSALPVPVSPSISTSTSTRASWRMVSRRRSMAGDSPISGKPSLTSATACRRRRFSSTRRRVSIARRTEAIR